MSSLLSAMRPSNVPGGRLWAAVLLVLALGVMGWALSLALTPGAAPAQDPPVAAPDTAAEGTSSVPAGPSPGGLTAGGTPVLPLAGGPAGDLSALVGRSIEGSAVTVESVAADEGFWVGTAETDRVWVQLVGDGESPYSVQTGDRVDIAGQMVAHGPDYARQIGVDSGEGAELLTRQAAHLEVPQSELRPSS